MKKTELNGNNETHTNLKQLIYCPVMAPNYI